MRKTKRWLLILIVTPLAAIAAWWGFLLFLYYVIGPIQGLSHIKDHKFVSEGTPKIEVAKQIEEIFGPSRRYISYGVSFDDEFWNSELILYGRYEFSMQVPIKIISVESGAVTGQPVFQIGEISEVTTNNGVGANFTNGWTFYKKDWEKLYKAKGDFRSIGIVLKTNAPVENIDAYIRASRNFE